MCVASYTMAEEQGHSEEEHFEKEYFEEEHFEEEYEVEEHEEHLEEEHIEEEHFEEEYEVEEHEEHLEEEHIEEEGRIVEYNTPPRAKKFINWLELPNMALDISQSGSSNFRSSSVVYRTQFSYSFYCKVCQRDISCHHQGIADLKRHEKTSSHDIRVRSMQGSSKLRSGEQTQTFLCVFVFLEQCLMGSNP